MTLKEKVNAELKASVISIAEGIEKAASGEELAEYLEDVLDVEISIGGDFRYRGVEIQLAFGGPNIYFNTNTGEVKGYWGTDKFSWCVKSFAVDAVDDYFEEYYNSCR